MATLNENINEELDRVLNENSVPTTKAYVAGMSINNFMDFIHGNDITSANDKLIYDQMMQDGTVSSIINAYMSDLIVRDKVTNHVCNVICDDTSLVDELSKFLYDDLKIDDNISMIGLRAFCYGCAPTELCSIDSVTDKQWNLYIERCKKQLDGDKLLESVKNFQSLSDVLKEDQLNISKKTIRKRWYINILADWRLKCLETKGKTIAFINPDDTSKIYDGTNLVPFINKSATDTTTVTNEDGSDTYTITSSESFLDKAKTAFRVLSSFEDLLLIHALTTSINYRIFQVDVGTLGSEETVKLLNDIKKRINENESFNLENSFYNSSMTGVPMGASIVIPTRGGVGTLQVQQIDNVFGTDSLGDFNYFKDKLANALMASPALLGNSTNGNGGLATGAATEVLDERAHTFIEKYRLLLASGIENLCDLYLQQTRTKSAYNKLPKYSIRMSKNTSKDQVQILQAQEAAAQSLQKVIGALSDIGIEFGNFPETRIQLIRQFLGDELADTLSGEMEDQDNVSNTTSEPTGDEGGDFGGDFEPPIDDNLDMGNEEVPDEETSDEDILEEPGVEV